MGGARVAGPRCSSVVGDSPADEQLVPVSTRRVRGSQEVPVLKVRTGCNTSIASGTLAHERQRREHFANLSEGLRPQEQHTLSQVFASVKLYIAHIVAALLYERREDNHEMMEIYNKSRKHAVQVEKTDTCDAEGYIIWHLHVRLNTNGLSSNRVKPWHDDKTSATLIAGKKRYTLPEKVVYPLIRGFDFVVKVKPHQTQQKAVHELQEYETLVEPTYVRGPRHQA